VRPNTIGQVGVTPRALVCVDAERIKGSNLSQVESSCTTNAVSDIVVSAINEEKRTLLGTQSTRPTTIEMTQNPVGEDDGVIRRERPCARPADPRLLFHPDPQSKPVASAGCR
jgi:hypothetical protein